MSSLLAGRRHIVAVVLCIVLVVAGLVGVQALVSLDAQRLLGQTEVKMVSVDVLGTSSQSLDLNMTLEINNPSAFAVTVGTATLEVEYDGSPLGSFEFPGATVTPGSNLVTFQCSLAVSSADTLAAFLEAFISSGELQLGVKGDLTLQALVGLGVFTSLALDKSVGVEGMGGLAGSRVTGMELVNGTDDSLFFKVNVTIVNPTKVSASLNDVSMDLLYGESVLGNLVIGAVDLQSGDNLVQAEGLLKPSNLTAVQEIASTFLAGKPCNFEVSLNASSLIQGLTSAVQINLDIPAELPGLTGVEVYLNEMNLTSVSDNSVTMDLNITLWNPSAVVGWLPELLMDVVFDGSVVGTISLPPMPFFHGNNTRFLRTTFIQGNATALRAMMTPYLNSTDIQVEVRGSPQGNLLSTILTNWNQTFTLESPGTLSIEVRDVWLINSSPSSVFLGVNLSLWNPTNINLNLSKVQFDTWVNGTTYLGNITLGDLHVTAGWNNISADVEVIAQNDTLLSELIERYMEGNNISLHLEGISFGNVIGSIVGTLAFDLEMAGVTPLDIAVISLILMNASDTSLVLNVTVEISNPTQSNVTVENLNFSLYYQGEFLGNLSLPTLNVQRGIHPYNLIVNFTIANQTLLDVLLTDYFTGAQIPLLVTGAPGGTDILSKALEGYSTWITLPPLDLEPEILSFDIVDSTSDSLHVQANISLTNPAAMNITIQSVNLTLLYNGEIVGNVSLGNIVLEPGQNIVQADIYLTTQYNETALEEMLSGYLVGENQTIRVEGEFQGDMDGLINMTYVSFAANATLEGIQEDLIQQVVVTGISVTLDFYTGSGSYTIYSTATIYNPLPFDINITYLSYDLYFDDDDGASIFGFPTYGPRSNIYLTTMTHNYTSNPLELASNSTQDINDQFTSSDVELAVRLYDEYYVDNDLYIDIRNGKLTVMLGPFQITLSFEFEDIYVPN